MTALDRLDDLVMGWRLLRRLPGHLREPMREETARGVLQRRRERREEDFLALIRGAVFAQPASPYLQLLRDAGCDWRDLDRHVRSDGVEATLETLRDAGVFLTVDEFKGRRPVVRGGREIAVDPVRLRNPLAAPSLWGTSSGSRGRSTQVPLDVASIRDRAVNVYLTLSARGGADWSNAVWGAPGLAPLLWYSVCGRPAERWFSKVDLDSAGVGSRYAWSIRLVGWSAWASGVRLPALEPVALRDPLPIARWMAEVRRRGAVPHLWAAPSAALRLSQAAEREGIDLSGCAFTLTGEPLTAARLEGVRRTGASAVPDYGCAESGGPLSYGCLAPSAADEVHFFDDLHALIVSTGGGLPSGSLLLTSLRPTAPFLLLNVSMGDRAVVGRRDCGCALERLGWRIHLHTIRSDQKLTAGGLTLLDIDVVPVLAETLPRRFGGGPDDYQLIEDETSEGHARLRLQVAPSVGPIDESSLTAVFLQALASASPTASLMAAQLGAGGFLTIERRMPTASASGKVLHLLATRDAERP